MLLRLTGLLGLVLLASGCGVKTAYNNLDRLIVWWAEDFVEFDARQKTYLRTGLDELLYWHRTTQLPRYAEGLRDLDREVRKGIDLEALLDMEARVRTWGEALGDASAPLVAELLHSLSDAQIAQLEAGFEANNRRIMKPYAALDSEARRQRWGEEFADSLAYFTGRLTKSQEELIDRYRARYRPDEDAWLGYRQRWQAALVELIRSRRDYVAFELAYRDMASNRERWYGDAYRALFEHNEAMYRDLTLALLRRLDAKQMDRLSDRLLGIAADFEQLAGAAPTAPAGGACLVTCSAQLSEE